MSTTRNLIVRVTRTQQAAATVQGERAGLRRRERGVALVYLMMIMAVMCGIVSFAVDYGRVQTAKTELQRSADSAAHSGAMALPNGFAAATAEANAMVQANLVDGAAGTMDVSQDIQFGIWNAATRMFSLSSGTNTNAVKVTLVRTAQRGNAIPLIFAQALGVRQVDIHATAT